MSCHVTRPSEAALQTALQTVLKQSQPPPLVPHPPEKNNMAWRTRRIVAELNALKSVESLCGFEAELRGVLTAQETRCRTKVITAALGDECAVRERESLAAAETVARGQLTRLYYAVTGRQFDVVHLRMVEETTRRALRRSERAARRELTLKARIHQLFLRERRERRGLATQEECCREELQYRRVIEIGNDLQREIIATGRLSGHLRSVAHSRTVQEARHQVELQEDRDRSAVERLYELHTILLFEQVKEDFTATIQRDVVLLSDAGRHAAQEADVAACTRRLERCVEQETELRELVEGQEAQQFKTLAQSFLLGWRSVFKAITKDPDVIGVFSKIELLVRREIADQERNAFSALQLASACRVSALQRQQAERRRLCQDYVTGARAVWAAESRAANDLFSRHHRERAAAEALRATTVLTAAEAAARRGICGAEAQARLTFKMAYATASVLLHCVDGTQRLCAEEARDFAYLQHRYIDDFRTQQAEALAMAERAARVAVERAESLAAADTFVLLRQSLAASRASDATRPLLSVETELRSSLAEEEQQERRGLWLQHCRLTELVSRRRLEGEERTSRHGAAATQVAAAEEATRRALCHVAAEELEELLGRFLAAATAADVAAAAATANKISQRSAVDGYAAENGDDGTALADKASLQLSGDWALPECVEQAWSEVYADWELTDNASSTASLESRKVSAPPLLNAYAIQCEEVLTDAYLERDVVHFTEHAEWRRLLRQARDTTSAGAAAAVATPSTWRLHSVSLKQEPNQRAASLNMWDSNQLFDVTFSIAQQQEEAIVGERTIAFYVPIDASAAAVLPRRATTGMVFFLVLDEEGTVLSSATLIMETGCEKGGCLCVALNNSAGYLRFE